MIESRTGLGNRLAPVRFIIFALAAIIGIALATSLFGWVQGVMLGFDVAALIFLLSCIPLLGHEADAMRVAAKRNDANRVVLLIITLAVTMVILVAVGAELSQQHASNPATVALVIGTLFLSWLFSNIIYALHYAHLFYTGGRDGKDSKGIEIPGENEPDYWDFIYFSFTLGMTFQTSDIEIKDRRFRRVAIFHCLAAFVFNIGVLAFTINVLGG